MFRIPSFYVYFILISDRLNVSEKNLLFETATLNIIKKIAKKLGQ